MQFIWYFVNFCSERIVKQIVFWDVVKEINTKFEDIMANVNRC